MERTAKTWLLEIIVAAILAALLGLLGWTAAKVVENGKRIIEVKAELQQQIAENRREIAVVRAELGREIAEVSAKMDLIISGLNISVAPKESAGASAEPGAQRSGFRAGAGEFQVGAGEAATE